MRMRLLHPAHRFVAMLIVACTVGAAHSSSAQAPAWVQLSPPAEVTLHVRDSRRDREIFFDQSGLVAIDDLAATRYSRIFFGANPVLTRDKGFAFYDFARDRIWAMSLPISDSLKLWTLDLADAAPAWTPPAYISSPALADTVIMDSGLVLDDAHDRLLSFGGFVTLRDLCLHCVPPGATNAIYQLTLAGTPQWSPAPADGPGPGPRAESAMVRDPWRDRVVVFGGVSFGPVVYDETWALSLGTPMSWTLLNPTVIPPPGRVVDSAVLDPLGRRWYIHGLQPGLGGGPPTYALDLSNAVNDADATWSEVAPAAGTVASYPAMTFIQPGQNRLVAMDGTSEWRLPLSAPTDWQLVPGGPVRRRDLVGFVDPATQRLYAGLGPDDQFQWRPIGQEVPWTPLGTQGPSDRLGASAGVDPVGGKVWVFGGHDQSDDVEYAELWSMNLSTSQWALASAGNPPLPRSEALGVFDSAHRRFVVHGGRYTNPNPVALGDTWVYDAVAGSWSSPAAGSYGLLYGEVGIYDPVGDRVLAFGGNGAGTSVHVLPLGTTIGSWSVLATSGTPPDWSDEETLAATYDPEADRMLVLGGVSATTLWALNLTGTPTWEQLALSGTPPPQRRGVALAYDAATHRLLIFGGSLSAQPGSDPGDVWAAVFPPGVVATELSLSSVDASPDGVTLRWYGSSSAASGTVYRREPGSAWRALGATAADGLGHWSWMDRDVTPGAGYDYRLGVVRNGTERFFGETHVDVPLRNTFALAGVLPNPSDGPLSVTFSLPGSAPATLELFDVTGRRIAERAVGGLGAGSHQLRLDSDRVRPAPGLYLVRLRQSGKERFARVVIAR